VSCPSRGERGPLIPRPPTSSTRTFPPSQVTSAHAQGSAPVQLAKRLPHSAFCAWKNLAWVGGGGGRRGEGGLGGGVGGGGRGGGRAGGGGEGGGEGRGGGGEREGAGAAGGWPLHTSPQPPLSLPGRRCRGIPHPRC